MEKVVQIPLSHRPAIFQSYDSQVLFGQGLTDFMKPLNLRYLFIGLAMLAAAGLALALTPRKKLADQGPKIDLMTMIPMQFEDRGGTISMPVLIGFFA